MSEGISLYVQGKWMTFTSMKELIAYLVSKGL